MNLDPRQVQQEITALLVAYPELKDDEVLRGDMIEGETTAFEFLRRVVWKIFEVQINADGAEIKIRQLQERKARFDRGEEGLRALITRIMNIANLRSAILPEATLSIRAGTPKVVIIDETEIPDEFMRIKREPDKVAIKAALVNGGHVSGTALSNAEPVLNMRIK